MARPQKLTPDQLDFAAGEIARGAETLSSLAEKLGVSGPGLGQALKRRKAGKRPGARPAPAVAPDLESNLPESPHDVPAVALPADVRDVDLDSAGVLTREQQKAFFGRVITLGDRQYQSLMNAGETKEARQVLSATVQASAALLRLEKLDGVDNMTISKEELAARRERVQRVMRVYLATKRPLLCADCNRELGIRWGKGEIAEGET